jgi:hypothetical protein
VLTPVVCFVSFVLFLCAFKSPTLACGKRALHRASKRRNVVVALRRISPQIVHPFASFRCCRYCCCRCCYKSPLLLPSTPLFLLVARPAYYKQNMSTHITIALAERKGKQHRSDQRYGYGAQTKESLRCRGSRAPRSNMKQRENDNVGFHNTAARHSIAQHSTAGQPQYPALLDTKTQKAY